MGHWIGLNDKYYLKGSIRPQIEMIFLETNFGSHLAENRVGFQPRLGCGMASSGHLNRKKIRPGIKACLFQRIFSNILLKTGNINYERPFCCRRENGAQKCLSSHCLWIFLGAMDYFLSDIFLSIDIILTIFSALLYIYKTITVKYLKASVFLSFSIFIHSFK